MNLTEFFTSIANAIRTKKGTTELINAVDFPSEIENLPAGGEENAVIDVEAVLTNTYEDSIVIKKMIKKIPVINTSQWTSTGSLFSMCSNLIEIPLLDTSNVTDMYFMFNGCLKLTTIPQLDTSNVTDMSSMFNSCSSLTTIPQLDTSKVNNMSSMFNGCSNLIEIPQLNTINVTNMVQLFNKCKNLTTIPQLNTSKVVNMYFMFANCSNLTTIPQLDTSKVANIKDMFMLDYELINLGGFLNLGKAYTQKTNSYANYRLDLSYCTKLTHESLMNVINNLYDLNLTYNVSNGGKLYTQQLQLGSDNLAKLTSEELSIATSKGWSVS